MVTPLSWEAQTSDPAKLDHGGECFAFSSLLLAGLRILTADDDQIATVHSPRFMIAEYLYKETAHHTVAIVRSFSASSILLHLDVSCSISSITFRSNFFCFHSVVDIKYCVASSILKQHTHRSSGLAPVDF